MRHKSNFHLPFRPQPILKTKQSLETKQSPETKHSPRGSLPIFVVLVLSLLWVGVGNCQTSPQPQEVLSSDLTAPDPKPTSFQKIAPLTTNALGTGKTLHEEGFGIVSSTKKSLSQVQNEAKLSSLTAKALVLEKIPSPTKPYPEKLQRRISEIHSISSEQRKQLLEGGREIQWETNKLMSQEWELSQSLVKSAYTSFVMGYVSFGERNKSSQERLQKGLNSFKEILKIPEEKKIPSLWDSHREKIKKSWRDGLSQSSKEFQAKLQDTGDQNNSLLALVDVFEGYYLALKNGTLEPSANTVTKGTELVAVDGIAIPIQTSVVTWKNLVLGTGLVVVYPFETGYQLMSPSFESGILGSMSVLCAVSTAPTNIGGTGVYGFQQITVATTIPLLEGGVKTTGVLKETGTLFAGLSYDLVKDTSKTIYFSAKAGMILGYSALLAIPTHLLISVPDGVVVLTYDGPRLVIATVRGNNMGWEDMPAGTVLDTDTIRKMGGKVEILTDDPETIQKVMEGLKKDIR